MLCCLVTQITIEHFGAFQKTKSLVQLKRGETLGALFHFYNLPFLCGRHPLPLYYYTSCSKIMQKPQSECEEVITAVHFVTNICHSFVNVTLSLWEEKTFCPTHWRHKIEWKENPRIETEKLWMGKAKTKQIPKEKTSMACIQMCNLSFLVLKKLQSELWKGILFRQYHNNL